MPTYIYETTIPSPDGAAERFEIRQRFGDPPLTTHPATGMPVRRVISGGLAVVASTNAMPGPSAHGCGPETCQCGRFS
jgi:predicted nucleic acid-binding Zn ribbon protein